MLILKDLPMKKNYNYNLNRANKVKAIFILNCKDNPSPFILVCRTNYEDFCYSLFGGYKGNRTFIKKLQEEIYEESVYQLTLQCIDKYNFILKIKDHQIFFKKICFQKSFDNKTLFYIFQSQNLNSSTLVSIVDLINKDFVSIQKNNIKNLILSFGHSDQTCNQFVESLNSILKSSNLTYEQTIVHFYHQYNFDNHLSQQILSLLEKIGLDIIPLEHYNLVWELYDKPEVIQYIHNLYIK